MSKKLNAEIEKCLKEVQTQIQMYDFKWRELKSYNEATANPDWATVGSGVNKCNAPDPLFLSGLKLPKKSNATNTPGGSGCITVDITNMTEKQVTEVKDKLKTELENLMKKVYRCRQIITDSLSSNVQLRQTNFTREQLIEAKKEIEARHRRGKVYYLKGVSSEDPSNEQASQFNEVVSWMQEYIQEFKNLGDQCSAELDILNKSHQKQDQSTTVRGDLLRNAAHIYQVHANCLEECLRGVRNNTISVNRGNNTTRDNIGSSTDDHTSYTYHDDTQQDESADSDTNTAESARGKRHGLGSCDSPFDSGETSTDLIAGTNGKDLALCLKRLEELKEVLTPLIDDNDEFTYIVGEEIYEELGINVPNHHQSAASPTQNNIRSVEDHTNPIPQPSDKVVAGGSFEKVRNSQINEQVAQANPLNSTPLKMPSAMGLQSAITPPVSAEIQGSEMKVDDDDLERRMAKLRSLTSKPAWIQMESVVLCRGVTSNVYQMDFLSQLNPKLREQFVSEMESVRNNSNLELLPVLVMDDAVMQAQVIESWSGELPGIDEITHQKLKESSLLFVNIGDKVELLASGLKDNWIYGRLVTNRSIQGWFPAHIINTDPLSIQ